MKIFTFMFISALILLAGCAKVNTSQSNKELINKINEIELEAKEVEQGVLIKLPTIMLFDLNSVDLKVESRKKIKDLAMILDQSQTVKQNIIVNGYADTIGEELYNLDLSQRRAESVSNEFVFNGIHKSRIEAKGYGIKFPVAPNTHPDGSDNPEGRSKNRRVEIIITPANPN